MKQVYMVLGMPRSGTSAVAKSLSALGVNLGDHLQPADSRNPRGFYEDLDVMYKINRGVSRVNKHAWMDVDTDLKKFDMDPALKNYKNYAIGLVCERLATNQDWGFKDPRTISILPFWQSVLKAVNAEDRYVIVIRHPLAAAHSLQKFAHTDLENGLILWVRTVFSAIEGTKGKKRVVVNYETLLQAPRAELKRMHRDLAIPVPFNDAEVQRYASDFIDKTLRHHEYTDDDLRMHPATNVASICVKLYAFAMRLARDEISFDSEEYMQSWQALKNEIIKAQPVFDYIELLRNKNKELERKVRTMQKSWPWKLIYPLRIVDDVLRMRRRKSRHLLGSSNEY